LSDAHGVGRFAPSGDRVAAVARDEFGDALDAVSSAATAYRGGLTDDDDASALDVQGTNPWTPIYSQLLTELEAALQLAGHRYDRLAEARLIDRADWFDWRRYLTSPTEGGPAAR
jgi:hypothetical protein